MDVTEAVTTRIELKEYSDESVDAETKRAILDAGRLAPSGRNLQHWRFILVDQDDKLADLADASPSGQWVADTDFAVAICTDPSYDYHGIDAGRAVTQMQLVAWEHGVGSRIYTVDTPEAYATLEIPDQYDLTLIAGFGYPTRDVQGVKDRKPLEEITYRGKFGSLLHLENSV